MNNYQNDSLLEAAIKLMKSKKKPKVLKELTDEVFKAKGIKENLDEKRAQFQMDFMLSGYFVCCGENNAGNKLWDLKSRQPSTLLDRDGNYLEDLYADDEDVIKNELKDDVLFTGDNETNIDAFIEDDEEEESETETDDIEEELGLVGLDEEAEGEATTTEIIVDEEDEEDDEEEDDIEAELK